MPALTLTRRHLNRAMLARQLLLQRVRLPIARAVERVGGIQAQYAPSAYVGLWSRLDGFARTALTGALTDRRVVQGTLMRATIHLVSAADYPLFAAGLRTPRREWWLRVARGRGLDAVAYHDVVDLLRVRLAAGPQRSGDLIAALVAVGYPKEAWEGAGLWLDMVRVPPSGTWERRRADLLALADTWLAPVAPVGEETGQAHLLRRYLGSFGPAPLAAAANWAGVPVATLAAVAEPMRLRHLRDEEGNELLDLARAPLPDPDTPAPVRFLPTWDAVLLAHARRAGILPEEHRATVFTTRNPHSVGTFLVDGAVAGTWIVDGPRINAEPFAPLPLRLRRELATETERLAAFHA